MRAGNVLALNCGSSSVKFSVFDPALALLTEGSVGNIGSGLEPCLHVEGETVPLGPGGNSHEAALAAILSHLGPRIGELAVAGHRVVHGGQDFGEPVLVDGPEREAIAALTPLAPAHQPHNLAGIDAVSALLPELPQVAVFDTAFHRTIPRHRQLMPLPPRFAEAGLRRFGFHGISYASIVPRLPALLGERAAGRVVICHLGNGCSLAGLVAGVCATTSMGFTPLDGLMMGRRPGRLDPGAVLWLVEHCGGDTGAVRRLLNEEAGLLGVSGVSSDMRVLLAGEDDASRLAVSMFVDCLLQELGAAIAAIGGLDALVFTGGIGENAAPVRASVVEGLRWLGVRLDAAANARNLPTVSDGESRVAVCVLPTHEERFIAQAAAAFIPARPPVGA